MDESPRILGVDDSLTIRKALELVLKPAGYNLELAANGAEAVEKAHEFQPAILLLDFILPDMAGTEVCKRLAASPETADIPVVLISAKGAEIRQAYQDVGNVVSYITKPFTPDVVTGVVADVLERVRTGTLIKPEMVPLEEIPVPEKAPAPREAASVESIPPQDEIAPPAGAWEEAEELYEAVLPEVDAAAEEARRDALEMMFETLRAGLEGVYVEEVEIHTGGSPDASKSYAQLASQLAQQFSETLLQARSSARFALSRDGSLRSLDEALLDAYRRVCRLLLRAVSAGAVEPEMASGRARVLLVCRRDSPLRETFESVRGHGEAWSALLVSERFRQLPIVTRLFGPTHLVVEACRGGAIADQVKVIQSMPESRRIQVVGIVPIGGAVEDMVEWKALGFDSLLEDGPEVVSALREKIEQVRGSGEPPLADAEDSGVSVAEAR